MDKEIVVHIHNRILLSYKKELSSNEVDEVEPIILSSSSSSSIQRDVSQKEKDKYHILTHIY